MDYKTALAIYKFPELYYPHYSKKELEAVKQTVLDLFPDIKTELSDNDMLKLTKQTLKCFMDGSYPSENELESVMTWLDKLHFPENDKSTKELVERTMKAVTFYGKFHKDKLTDCKDFLNSIQLSDFNTYEEMYNSLTEKERNLIDEYYKNLFRKNAVSMTDEEKDAIKRGAELLKSFKHEDLYNILEKFFK